MTGLLSALVLRAEWSLAQAATETRTQATFDMHVAEKQSFLEKVDGYEKPEAKDIPLSSQSAPPPTSGSGSETAESESQPSPPKPRSIRVPPIDFFHLAKEGKYYGRLEPFPSPIFNILLLTTFLCYVPAILLSTPTLNHYTETSTAYELLWTFPAQIWTLLAHPIVLAIVLLARRNKDGRKIWRYGEKWSKDLPPKTETTTDISTIPSVLADIESQAQPPLVDVSA